MNKTNIKKFILAFSLVIIVWLLSGILTQNSTGIYKELIKPMFSPPGYVFAIVWPILYLMMAYSLYLVLKSDYTQEDINIFILQLLFNFFWPILFFVFEFYLFSSVWLLILIGLIVINISKFYKVNKTSAYLLIPYLSWCIFALYLNLSIYILNI